MAELAGLA